MVDTIGDSKTVTARGKDMVSEDRESIVVKCAIGDEDGCE